MSQKNTKFKKGDVVILNSGGPKMTVESVEIHKPKGLIDKTLELLEEPKYIVVWFDKEEELKKDSFTESALKLSE